MTLSLGPADVVPAATVCDVAQLLDVEAQQGTGPVVLVAAGPLAGASVDVVSRLGRQRRSTARTVEGGSPRRAAISTGPKR